MRKPSYRESLILDEIRTYRSESLMLGSRRTVGRLAQRLDKLLDEKFSQVITLDKLKHDILLEVHQFDAKEILDKKEENGD